MALRDDTKTFDSSILRSIADIGDVNLDAVLAQQMVDRVEEARKHDEKICVNCTKQHQEHIIVRAPFDSHTPIGIGLGERPILAVLCPTSVFKEL